MQYGVNTVGYVQFITCLIRHYGNVIHHMLNSALQLIGHILNLALRLIGHMLNSSLWLIQTNRL